MYKTYQDLKDRYTNCTYVEGNLEITWLRDPDFDLSFLDNIREVTGYVMIALYYPTVISLKNLRVIRGMDLYEDKYSLYIGLNYNDNDDTIGLRELHLPSLHGKLCGWCGVYSVKVVIGDKIFIIMMFPIYTKRHLSSSIIEPF